VRVVALALVASALLAAPASAEPSGVTVVARDGARLAMRAPGAKAPYRQLGLSGDGRLVSIGGWVVGHVKLPTRMLTWAPTGERAAYVTTEGAVVEWTPQHGRRFLEPKGWGATIWGGIAWARDGALAVARANELWVLRRGSAARVAGPLPPNTGTGGPDVPEPFAWIGDHVLWWRWPGSGSVAADGVDLYEDGTRLGTMLAYRDYAATCGSHLAFVSGGDRYSTAGKSIVFDGRDVSADPRLSWVEPSCNADGRLVAAAGTNTHLTNLTETHRAIWQLLPARKRLTSPPWGWSDEDPRLLPDGSLLFVRTRIHSVRNGDSWLDTQTGRVMLLRQGKLVQMAKIGYRNVDELKTYLGPYYGHYDWATFLAVRP
jgi:hypothetical protein